MASASEHDAMCRAIALADAAAGSTNPNPCVGAVVLNHVGEIVGEAVTASVGGDHAEVGALRAAGADARGGTVVVTLEPCSHVGRTGPCTEAIVAAGVARVVYSQPDPHHAAAGGGDALRAAGVDVEADLLAPETLRTLGPWLSGVDRDRPHLTWKYAATLDGRIAAADGTSKWITGEAARRDVHRERYRADAVIVGVGTVLADDPRLTVRDWPATRQPLRVVLDSHARTPTTAALLDDAAATLIAVTAAAPADRVAALQARGAEVVIVTDDETGRVDVATLLRLLRQREVIVGFLESGATLAAALLRAELVDRVIGYYAPMMLGDGVPLVAGLGVTTLGDARRWSLADVAVVGDDVRIVASASTRSQ